MLFGRGRKGKATVGSPLDRMKDWAEGRPDPMREVSELASALRAAESLAMSDPQRAVPKFHETLRLAVQLADRRVEGRSLLGLGIIAFSQGNLQEASAHLNKAGKIALETDDAPLGTSVAGLLDRIVKQARYDAKQRSGP